MSISRWRQVWTIFVVIVVIILGVVFGWGRLRPDWSAQTESVLPRQVATVNGVAITQEMVERELAVSRLNVVSPLAPLTGDDLERAKEEALNQLINRQLILQATGRQGFALEEEFIAERTALLFGGPDDEAVMNALAQAGATYADLLWWAGGIFTVEEFTSQVIMAGADPEARQQVYNEWFNEQRAKARIETYLDGEAQASSIALIGQPAPNFTLTTFEGQPVSLSDYAGKVVLINFWATWCPSCVSEMPDYERVFRQKTPEFVVLGVNLQESGEHVQQYAAGLGLTFPVLLDENGNVTTRQYQVTGMPGSFIIDRQGKIFYRHIGPMNTETLTAKLAELGL